jgi:hypothetical protein
MSDEKEVREFLSRWSRRKIDARRAESEAKPPDPPVAPVVPVAVPPSGAGESAGAVPLPPVEELRGLESEYREFLRPEVDDALRRNALKKLFQDPHFNVMDGLDTYIDDYTKADPIPEAMLRALNQAQGLIYDREDGQRADAAQPADAAPLLPQPSAADTKPNASPAEAHEDGKSGPDTPSAAT